MLTLESVTSASEGAKYYFNASYHSLDKEASQYQKWYGKGAAALGLSGDAKEADFQKILEGKITYNDENIHLGNRNNGEIDHAPGRDLTFAAPKSVSLQHNLEGGDKRIKNALIKAAENTLEYIQENFIYTRVKQDGKVTLEKTDNIIGTLFYENLNRDKEFHDHVHCVIANITQRANGSWRSTELRRIFDNQIHIGKVFRMELAYAMKSLGYDLEISNKEHYFFEIKGFDKKLSENFSERTQTILAKAKELNKNLNVKVRQLANFLTRETDKSITSAELKVLTDHKIENYAKKSGKSNILDNIAARTVAAQSKKISSTSSANTRKALGYAISHLSERSTIFNKKDIIDIAKDGRLGEVNLKSINKEINHLLQKEFILHGSGKYKVNNGSTCYTTRHALEREKAIIGMLIDGKDKYKSIISSSRANDLLKNISLNQGQKDAAKLILTTKDRVFAIQGYAGTGKTYMLSKLKEVISTINQEELSNNPKHIPYQLLGLAPSGAAVKELQKSLGSDHARTLQGFLAQYDGYSQGRGTLEGKKIVQKEFQNKVLIVDEASMISSSQMKDLMVITKILDVRMVPVGDSRQLLAVEEGNPFYEMQREGMSTVTMTENVRQKTAEGKAISYSAYARDFTKIFNKIGTNLVDCTDLLRIENHIKIERGDLKEDEAVNLVSNTHTALAASKLYMSFDKDKQNNTLMISQSNQTKDLVNSFVRQILIDKKELGEQSSNIKTLINRNLSIAQRGEVFNYKEGDVLLFNKGNNSLGIKKDEYLRITSIKQNGILELERDKGGKKIMLNLAVTRSYCKNIEVYEPKKMELRTGDQIIFTRKIEDKKNPIVNSTLGIVQEISNNSYLIEIEGNKTKIEKNSPALNHLDYSYCRTTHKGQGATTKTAIIIAESWWSHLTNQRNILVQATRQKEELFLIVDNKQKVIQKIIENKGDREGAIEFIENNQESLIKKEELKQNLFKATGGSEEYNKYQIALKEANNFNHNINNRAIQTKLSEPEISPTLTQSSNINQKPRALEIILGLQDKSVTKLEEFLSKEGLKQSKAVNIPADNSDKIQSQAQQTTKSKVKYTEFSNHELSQKWEEEISRHFVNSDLKNLTNAIDKAFKNNGLKVRLGNKNSCELVWYGKAGYIRDYKTGDDLKWGEGNIKLSNDEKKNRQYKIISKDDLNNLKKETQNKLKESDLAKKIKNLDAAKKATRIFNSIPESNKQKNQHHPYLTNKGIANIYNIDGIKFTKDGRLVIPVKDTKNNIHSLQYINHDGTKLFLKDGLKTGNFFLIGSDKASLSKNIFISEGFATAASVHLATKMPVVVCFDAGNIDPTLKNLKDALPNKNFIIAADDDKYTYIKDKQVNNGREKAISAAEKHGATVILPNFKIEDIKKFQQEIPSAKGPTDFNDLHKLQGVKSVQAQIVGENDYQNSANN